MVFRRCSVRGKDFGGHSVAAAIDQPADRLGRPRPSKDRGLEALLSRAIREADNDSPIYLFFLTMAICNTVVVNAKPHEVIFFSFFFGYIVLLSCSAVKIYL